MVERLRKKYNSFKEDFVTGYEVGRDRAKLARRVQKRFLYKR